MTRRWRIRDPQAPETVSKTDEVYDLADCYHKVIVRDFPASMQTLEIRCGCGHNRALKKLDGTFYRPSPLERIRHDQDRTSHQALRPGCGRRGRDLPGGTG